VEELEDLAVAEVAAVKNKIKKSLIAK